MSRTYRKNYLNQSEESWAHEQTHRSLLWADRRNYYLRIQGKPPICLDEATVEEEERLRYRKNLRDGKLRQSTCNQGFKNAAKKHTRRGNKRFCGKVLRDEYWENDPYPLRKEGKMFVWDWF